MALIFFIITRLFILFISNWMSCSNLYFLRNFPYKIRCVNFKYMCLEFFTVSPFIISFSAGSVVTLVSFLILKICVFHFKFVSLARQLSILLIFLMNKLFVLLIFFIAFLFWSCFISAFYHFLSFTCFWYILLFS